MIALDRGWSLALSPAGACQSPSEAAALEGWIPASVPGTAAEALEAAGLWSREAPAPLHDQDVWYRLDLPLAGRGLRFDGLATFAEAWLDEAPILQSDSMFRAWDVEREVRAGSILWICFRALSPRLAVKGPRARWRPRMIEHQGLRLVRTTLLGHMPGWCPAIHVVGPFRGVSVVTDDPRLVERRIRADWRDDGACLELEARIDGIVGPAVLSCADAEVTLTTAGDGWWRGELRPAAEPWWPHTHGEPRLYPVSITADGQVFDLGQIGFRRIEVDRGADGKAFGLRVNGQEVFCRGSCWIAPDLVSLAQGRADYEPTLRTAKAAGFNMIRVSGVGLYETRAFFEACDALGLMVWQDFMLANFDYPVGDPAFMAAAAREAEDQLLALQGCPSLAVLCGGSEVMQQAAMMGLAPADLAWPLFDEVLPGAVSRLRPDVPYVPNTPSGGALPFMVGEGVGHYYGVGAYERPLEDARRSAVRFASECLAFANVPDAASLAAGLAAPAVHDPRWKARTPRDRGASWDFEDVRDHYLERLLRQDPHRLRREDPELYLDLSRAVSGEAMAAVFSEWRRPTSSCAGGLIWTLQDQTVGAGWGVIDALGRAKPALRILSRVLQPIQVLMTDEGVDGLVLHILNETGAPVAGELRLAVYGEAAGALVDVSKPVELAPRSGATVSAFELIGRFFDLTHAYRFGPLAHEAVLAQLVVGGSPVSEAIYTPPSVTGWDNGGSVAATLTPDGDAWRLTLTADRLQRWVRLADTSGHVADDDWLPLLPGEPRSVRLSGGENSGRERRPHGEILAPGGRILGAYGD